MHQPIRSIDRTHRLIHAGIFLAGAVLLQLLVGTDDPQVGFYWTPLLLGIIYTVAALSGGRRGSYWSTGPVLLGWGGVVVWLNEARPDVFASSAYSFGMGLGVLLAGLLLRLGFRVDFISVGATATIAGLIFMFDRTVEFIGDGTTFTVSLAVIAAGNALFAFTTKAEPATA